MSNILQYVDNLINVQEGIQTALGALALAGAGKFAFDHLHPHSSDAAVQATKDVASSKLTNLATGGLKRRMAEAGV